MFESINSYSWTSRSFAKQKIHIEYHLASQTSVGVKHNSMINKIKALLKRNS